jgi:hypothetical protein
VTARRSLVAAGWLLAGLSLTACTAVDGAPTPSATSSAAAESGAPIVLPAPTGPPVDDELPVVRDAGYDEAVSVFGADQVGAALAADARIAHIALADCYRWTHGVVHPDLKTLLTLAFLATVKRELDLPPGNFRSLLNDLPKDDGNGHDLAAAARRGCDDSAPLRVNGSSVNDYADGLVVRVDREFTEPAMTVAGSIGMNVTLGGTQVSASQDWTFTSVRTAQGWQLVGAVADAAVNWAPRSREDRPARGVTTLESGWPDRGCGRSVSRGLPNPTGIPLPRG